MLISHPPFSITENKIYCFKLVTGEEVIAKAVSSNDKEVEVQQPLYLVQIKEGVAFSPMFTMSDDKNNVTFFKYNVVAIFEPGKEYRMAYIESISNVILPDKKIIIN